MNYQRDFDGSATAEAIRSLRSVEPLLNWHNALLQGQADTTAPGHATYPPSTETHPLADDFLSAHCVIIIVFAAVAAFVLGYVVGRKSVKGPHK